jgi:hypothetical protein
LIFMEIALLAALSSPACRLLRIDHCEGDVWSLITVMAAGHCAAFSGQEGSLVGVPAAGHRNYGLEEPSGWKGGA